MSSIKIEPTDFVEDDYLHVLRFKPDPDVFFKYFYDSHKMEEIRNTFGQILLQLRNYYCSLLQHLVEIGGEQSIPRIVMYSIGAYRSWYKDILDKLPRDYVRPLYHGFDQTDITLEKLKKMHKELKRVLLRLNVLVKSFDKKWGTRVRSAYDALEVSMNVIKRDLENFNAANQLICILQPLGLHMQNNTHLDPVTDAIISSFRTPVTELLFR